MRNLKVEFVNDGRPGFASRLALTDCFAVEAGYEAAVGASLLANSASGEKIRLQASSHSGFVVQG
ncbi:hypothetical protein ACRYJU_18880 [Alloalcanivorax xenomutans]|uniref:hypothetical protein n=1 Tax=Alloalcanivorax xenomutans TaxID=1094342 RepID=UPI000BE269FA|nr:hypothetical protein [Alloalcanivorax xenomutans]